MKLKFALQYLFVICIIPYAYAFIRFFLRITNIFTEKVEIAVFSVFLALLLFTFYIYFKAWIDKFSLIKFLFLTYVIRIFVNPFFTFLKLKVGYSSLCIRQPTTISIIDWFQNNLIYNVSQFILLAIILRFKPKDVFISSILVILSMILELTIIHYKSI